VRRMASAHRGFRLRPEALAVLRDVLEIVSHAWIRLPLRAMMKNDLLRRPAHRIQEFVMGLQVVHLRLQ
jgi:hypothetical protein